MVSDELCVESLKLYDLWRTNGGAGGAIDPAIDYKSAEEEYQNAAVELMVNHNCFKTFFVS